MNHYKFSVSIDVWANAALVKENTCLILTCKANSLEEANGKVQEYINSEDFHWVKYLDLDTGKTSVYSK